MLRHRAARSSSIEARLLISVRSPGDVFYHEELTQLVESDGLAVHHTFTVNPPPGWTGFVGVPFKKWSRAHQAASRMYS